GDVHTLKFLKRARDLGFSVEECRALLALYHETDRSNAEVKTLAANRVRELDRRLADLASIRDALALLAEGCTGDARQECPILDDLAADNHKRSSAACPPRQSICPRSQDPPRGEGAYVSAHPDHADFAGRQEAPSR